MLSKSYCSGSLPLESDVVTTITVCLLGGFRLLSPWRRAVVPMTSILDILSLEMFEVIWGHCWGTLHARSFTSLQLETSTYTLPRPPARAISLPSCDGTRRVSSLHSTGPISIVDTISGGSAIGDIYSRKSFICCKHYHKATNC